jgi:hypothetical protein
MNCLETRRSLMTVPRERNAALEDHLSECAECSRLAARVDELDARISEAALVPVPQGLADRVLYGKRARPRWPYAAAAAVLCASVLIGFAAPQVWEAWSFSGPMEAVGPSHPAVAAIAMVVEQQPAYLDEARGVDMVAMEDGLKRLGLSLRKDGVRVDYAARCYMPETECDHLVLDTPDGPVSVILVPDYPVGSRAMVADRRMTALVSPAGSGAYIVVAGSPKVAKRTEKLFVKGRV